MSGLAHWLAHFSRAVFIETGSKDGDSLADAAEHFIECHSIEINPAAHARCAERFQDLPHVHVHLGDSRDILPRIINPKRHTTFYLDAHCEGAPSKVQEADTECPLLGELEIITRMTWDLRPVIIIDDIHMFAPTYWTDPKTNHHLFTRADWPTFETINAMLPGHWYIEDAENRLGLWV